MIHETATAAPSRTGKDRRFIQILSRIPRFPQPSGTPQTRLAPLVLLAAAFLIDGFLAYRFSGYGKLVSLYEREPIAALYALERGGILPEAQVVALRSGGQVLFFERGGKEVLRLPYAQGDATNRTHLGVRKFGELTKILLFDPMHYNTPRRAVFTCADGACEETAPDREDRLILRALASVDDRGTLMFWDLFFLLRPFLWVGLLLAAYRWRGIQ